MWDRLRGSISARKVYISPSIANRWGAVVLEEDCLQGLCAIGVSIAPIFQIFLATTCYWTDSGLMPCYSAHRIWQTWYTSHETSQNGFLSIFESSLTDAVRQAYLATWRSHHTSYETYLWSARGSKLRHFPLSRLDSWCLHKLIYTAPPIHGLILSCQQNACL